MQPTTNSHELALMIVNDGEWMKVVKSNLEKRPRSSRVEGLIRTCEMAAEEYEMRYGEDKWAFSNREVILAALEVLEHMETK